MLTKYTPPSVPQKWGGSDYVTSSTKWIGEARKFYAEDLEKTRKKSEGLILDYELLYYLHVLLCIGRNLLDGWLGPKIFFSNFSDEDKLAIF